MKWLRALRISPAIQTDFWQQTLQKNRYSLLVICAMIFGMEAFNMARVLFWSDSGLSTRNNRIYFSLYAALFLAAAVYLLLFWALRRGAPRARLAAQYGAVLFFLLWHVCLNAYDLMRTPAAETSTFFTAVMALAVFIQMPWWLSVAAYAAAYGLFMALVGRLLDAGTQINLTITTIVALAVSLTHCRHTLVLLEQRREIGEINEKLQAMLRRDPLTGLLNTAAFQRRGQELLDGGAGALCILDLDDFKAVNDRYGHPCGDHVLRETAQALRAAFPQARGIGRVGGDEFAVLLAPEDGEAAEAMCAALFPALSRIAWQGQAVGVSCSVGVCRIGGPGSSYEEAYRRADRALYQAKGEGKGRCRMAAL